MATQRGAQVARSRFPKWGGIVLPACVLWGTLLGVLIGIYFGNALIGTAIGAALGVGIGVSLFAAAIVMASHHI
jgi:hypothetical protein